MVQNIISYGMTKTSLNDSILDYEQCRVNGIRYYITRLGGDQLLTRIGYCIEGRTIESVKAVRIRGNAPAPKN